MGSHPIANLNRAVSNLRQNAASPLLKPLKARRDGNGRPRVTSGGFALTYELEDATGRRYALRIFQNAYPEHRDRYRRLDEWFRTLADRKYFVETTYLPSALRVGGDTVDAILMDWAPGLALGQWFRVHSPGALHAFRRHLLDFSETMESIDFAHGDLQPGNVFYDEEAGITLIDYDAVWLPGFERYRQREFGHLHYQHPCREESTINGTTDRFSLIVLDLTAAALSHRPGMAQRYGGGERLLFDQADFAEPRASRLITELRTIPALRGMAEAFSRICTGPIAAVPSLAAFRAGADSPGARRYAPGRSGAARAGVAPPVTGTPPPAASPTTPAGELPFDTTPSFPTGAPSAEESRHRAPAAASPPTAGIAAGRRYRSPYPVCAGTAVDTIARHEGRKIEAVGRIDSLRYGKTANGDDYLFINFDDWRGRAFKITIWHDALETMVERPDERWRGRWISVAGLVQEPFTNERLGYTHYSIHLAEPSRIEFITGREAAHRLLGGGRRRSDATARGAGYVKKTGVPTAQ